MQKKGEKKSETKIDFVKWFSETNKTSGKIVGGKGDAEEFVELCSENGINAKILEVE